MATHSSWSAGSLEPVTGLTFGQLTQVRNVLVMALDAAADEGGATPPFKLRQGWTGAGTLVVTYRMATATTGSVRFEALVEAVTPGDAFDTDAGDSFAATNSAGGTVPATAGYEQEISITLTNNDGWAAGDRVRIQVKRDADGTTGTDDAVGDCYLVCVELRDAA